MIMKKNKIALMILIMLLISLTPLKKIQAHTVELDPESLISLPMMILGGSGTVTIKNTVTDYTLYFQAVKIDNATYSQMKQIQTNSDTELKKLKEEYTALKTEMNTLKEKYNTAYDAYTEGLKNTSLTETEKAELKTTYETAKTNYQNKVTEYNNKVEAYNNKVDEQNKKIKELTPMYSENNWVKTTNNEISIDTTKFSGEQPYTIWVKLVTPSATYYDEGIYTMTGTKTNIDETTNTITNETKNTTTNTTTNTTVNEITNAMTNTTTNEIKNKVTNTKKENDTTVAQGKLPFAGTNKIILSGIATIILIAIVFYNKYFKYKDIK